MANMVDSDDEGDAPMSIKDRRRLFERSNTGPSPLQVGRTRRTSPPLARSFTMPDRPAARRPQMSQLTSTSEEIIQKTKSGLLDLTEKGKATFQQAGNSVNDFKERLLSQKRSTSESRSSPVGVKKNHSGDLIEFSSEDEEDESSEGSEVAVRRADSPSSSPVVEVDRKEIETQLSEHFANFKIISQSAISTVSNATINPLVSGAKSGFDAASKNTSEFWHSSGAKSITDKMSEDLRDYANHTKGFMGLCSKCEKFPQSDSRSKDRASNMEMTFETPLERILYHSDWCRLCGFFLRNLCRPENDPFRHPQIAPNLQAHLKGKSFGQFVTSGSRYTDAHWPFGYGKQLHEGAFNYLDPVALKHKYQKQNVAVSTQLIPMMMKAVANSSRYNVNSRSPTAEDKATHHHADVKKQQHQKETSYENLVHPLECIFRVTIRTSVDLVRSGQVQASLLGYGRGSGAQIATLSQFTLRIEAEPSFGSPTSPLRYGNVIENGQIDLSLGAMWLHECEANHASHCREQNWSNAIHAPPSFRLIDVRHNCVTTAPTDRDIRFVALSYVWGIPVFETLKLTTDNIHQLSQKNGLAEYWHGVSTTVKDAMALVNSMGERYLWVDALCIIQDVDGEEKEAQIAAMDWLYSKALFTIVAADAQNSMSGLAGVRPASRSLKQQAAQVRPGTRLLTPLEAPPDLDTTVWSSRAWTFQERLLSRRLLVFQGSQMVWYCRSATAYEDMTPADKGATYPPLPWLTLRKQQLGTDGTLDGSIIIFPDQTTHIVRSETFSKYADLVSQYTHRQLTHDDDILSAFGGLLHIFRQFFRFPMRYGLPEILFDIALLWQPAEMLEDRNASTDLESPRFPSWSWAGWKGRVKYEEPFSASHDQFLGTLTRTPLREDEERREERIRPLIRWHFKNKSNDELIPLNKSGLGIPLFSKGRLPDEWDKTVFEDEPPPALKLPGSVLEGLESYHLVFQTMSISTFTLGKPLVQASDTEYNPANPPLRFNILNGSSKNVGTVLLDGEGPTILRKEKHEFLVISEAQYYGLDYEQGNGEGYPLYVVMLVEWRGGVARRLGLGRVDKAQWKKAGPRAKDVCLE